MFDTADKG